MSSPQDRGSSSGSATPGSGSGRGDTPGLRVSARDRAFLNAAAEIEATPATEAGTIGFVPQVWAQFPLPLRDPGNVSRWERRNGAKLLVLRPALLENPDGSTVDAYPFGLYPRLVLAHLATHAVTRSTPTVPVGSSLRDFLGALGLYKGGATGKRMAEQVTRLLGSHLAVKTITRRSGRGHVAAQSNIVFADDFSLWVPATDDPADDEAYENVPDVASGLGRDERMIWPDTVFLSPGFYAELTGGGAVPVDLRALRALSPWPMSMDIYVWLTWRMYRLSSTSAPGHRPKPITWSQLAGQFGSSFTRERDFRPAFAESLDRRVHPLYPAARYFHDERGLHLIPSPPHVAPLPSVRDVEAAPSDDAPRLPRRGTNRKPAAEKCPTHGTTRPCGNCRADRLAKGD